MRRSLALLCVTAAIGRGLAAASPRADMPAVWAGLGTAAPAAPAGPRTSTQEGLR
ncbi:hypothetical protein [uncultured Arthrobacter sp.]|uniref:hypothetical protein n=1 Tax=uncultured Arthrobacter sp. TaxID=114050 RepID=UPI0025E60AC8|nr:hypothetical protein [uncultured Arthrobacter sp.]